MVLLATRHLLLSYVFVLVCILSLAKKEKLLFKIKGSVRMKNILWL